MALQTEQGETSKLDDSGFIEPEFINSENDRLGLLEQEKFGNVIEIESEQREDEDGHVNNEESTMDACEGGEDTNGDYRAVACEGCVAKKERCRKLKRELKELKAVVREFERRDKKFAVPLDCSSTVRQVYRELRREETVEQWDTGIDSRYTSELNTTISHRIVKEVKSLFPQRWPKGVIREATRRYWQSVRDDDTRTRTGKKEMHRLKGKRQSRMRRKLQWRLAALKEIDWAEQRKVKVQQAMTMDYVSSEESDEENERLRVVRELSWESARLKKYKNRLDSFYSDVMLSDKAKRQRIPTVRKQLFSQRRPPHGAASWFVQ